MLLCLLNLLPVALHLTLKLADQPGIQRRMKDYLSRVKANTLIIPLEVLCGCSVLILHASRGVSCAHGYLSIHQLLPGLHFQPVQSCLQKVQFTFLEN